MLWFNYVVSFSDGVQKLGVTSRPFCHLQAQMLEADRHGCVVNGFFLMPPSAEKELAVQIKNRTRAAYQKNAIGGQRDSFMAEAELDADGRTRMMRGPDTLFYCLEYFVVGQWHEANPSAYAKETIHRYYEFIRFAGELGALGKLISPTRASALAWSLMCVEHAAQPAVPPRRPSVEDATRTAEMQRSQMLLRCEWVAA